MTYHPHHVQRFSLTMTAALLAAVVTALGMAVYAVFQYMTGPQHTVTGLFIEHSWHALSLGALTYLMLYAVLHTQVVRPVHALFLKCYTLSRGDLSPVPINSRIREIRTIADGLNFALARLRDDPPQVSADELSEMADELQRIVHEQNQGIPDEQREQLLNVAVKLGRRTV